MAYKFETLGNATLQLFEDGKPILATDPWLQGTCYFGSWALDHALTQEQIGNVCQSRFIWISHGHPDHLHPESLTLIPREPGPQIVIPRHYSSEIEKFLKGEGFPVRVLKFKEWTRLTPTLRVMCLEDMNQDAMLIVEAGDTLIINQNDALPFGQEPFLRRLVGSYPKTYLLGSCAMNTDMFNYIDKEGKPLRASPEDAKAAVIRSRSEFCKYLKVQNYCCSAFQQLFVRGDSKWANAYRVSLSDLKRHWNSPTRVIAPFVTVETQDGSVTQNHPSQESDMSQVSDETGEDNWDDQMNEEDWQKLEAFVHKFKILETEVDFIGFTVGGQGRTYYLNGRRNRRPQKQRGVNFLVPKKSLMQTVKYGYFDDLLIGNFMKTQLINMRLYPKFSPYIAKFGGNAKVFARPQLTRFYFHYFKLSPVAYIRSDIQSLHTYRLKPAFWRIVRKVGLPGMMKTTTRWLKG
jgi:hypothetical protein